jgi:hypothetical protein
VSVDDPSCPQALKTWYWRSRSRFYLQYEQRYNYFLFAGGHLGFHQDAAGIRCRSTFSCVGEPAYIVLGFGIAFLSSILPKLLLLPVYRPPCWTQGVFNKASSVALHFLAFVVPDSMIVASDIFFVPSTAQDMGTSVLLPPSWISD